MGKKRADRSDEAGKKKKSGTVNVGARLARMISAVCLYRGIKAEDYLTPILEPVVLADFKRAASGFVAEGNVPDAGE